MHFRHENSHVDMMELWRLRICPWCGNEVPQGSGVGTGRKLDGLFCDLNHYASFYFNQTPETSATRPGSQRSANDTDS